MQKFMTFAAMLLMSLVLVGCGDIVEIPPAHKGKVVSKEGYERGIRNPSSFRLPYGVHFKPQLVLVEVSDTWVEEKFKLFMPKDQLNLDFDIRGTYSINSDDDAIEAIFDRIKAVSDTEAGNVQRITFERVYDTYARQIVRTKARAIAAEYSIQEVMENREAVSLKIFNAVREELSHTPISVRTLSLADVQPPDVIIRAQEAAKRREIEIQEAENDKMVRLTQADAALEVAKKQQQVDLLEAETQVLVDKKLAEGVSPAFVLQRMINNFGRLADSGNTVILVPSEALHNPALLMGLNQQALAEAFKKRDDESN